MGPDVGARPVEVRSMKGSSIIVYKSKRLLERHCRSVANRIAVSNILNGSTPQPGDKT
jgi:hypothetical protein